MEESKTVRVDFNELAKSVTASVRVEVTGQDIDNDQILEEAKKLFNGAHQHAKDKTMGKSI